MRALWLLPALALAGCAALSAPRPEPAPVFAPVDALFLDADTANELDDLFAVAQVVADPNVELVALSSSHFNNTEIGTKKRWHAYDAVADLDRGLDTAPASQLENKRILALMGRTDIPAPLGAREMIGYSWGYFPGADVPKGEAVDAMIARARLAAKAGKRLDIAAVGPLTNVAAALINAPDIAPHIRIWWLGAGYDPDTGIWNKNRFNVRNDLNAADFVLDRDDVELVMMPTQTARALMFSRERTLPRLRAMDHPLSDHLADRWAFVGADREWTQWDMALTLATAYPEWATVRRVPAPPENARGSVLVFTAIDAPAMESHFFETLDAWVAAQR